MWIVLEKEGTKYLLLSEKVLDKQQYHSENKSISWENCSLRKWLSDSFYSNAFSAAESRMILSTEVLNADRGDYKGGNNTNDKVFLLSREETTKYFSTDEKAAAEFTAYANALYKIDSNKWWRRSNEMLTVIDKVLGSALLYCADISTENKTFITSVQGVRPALWIEIE